ncbi:type-2 ice-structuring protein-like, partial [Plectropomus leopardus]|uniref:type-2 ice-structuring protein-like n=1 Tax=Plectropomus leopardus TaxID=160734 RepID=UPI001C4D7C24
MARVFLRLLLAVHVTASLSSSEGPQQASPCPPRWLLFGQRCFAFYPVWSSWSTANSMCSQTGSDLASLHTPEERRFVRQMANTHTPVWLGGYQ